MTGLELAILGLRQAVECPRQHTIWRRLVRNRMAGVRDALSHDVTTDDSPSPDAWLVPRELGLQRQRVELRRRLALLGPRVLEAPDVDGVRAELQRLLADLEHHRQHLHDLVYDSVSVELGGSE